MALLRQAGQQQELVRGLLHRAALWRMVGEGLEISDRSEKRQSYDFFALAERDLLEAESIAERCAILIWQIETALERTRLCLALASADATTLRGPAYEEFHSEAQRPPKKYLALARETLATAKRLVQQTERPYDPHVPDWKDWQRPPYVGVFQKGQIVGYHRPKPEIELLEQVLGSEDDL